MDCAIASVIPLPRKDITPQSSEGAGAGDTTKGVIYCVCFREDPGLFLCGQTTEAITAKMRMTAMTPKAMPIGIL
jgi:hypothetical protein